MGYLNYQFFDVFKDLDNLCRDIYGESADHKLGVTMYIERMDAIGQYGEWQVPGWACDYERLKKVRNIRNEIAHSRNSISHDICSEEDIEFVSAFKTRILNQSDPLTIYRRMNAPRPAAKRTQGESLHNDIETSEDTHTDGNTPKPSLGKTLGCVATIMIFAGLLSLLLWLVLGL